MAAGRASRSDTRGAATDSPALTARRTAPTDPPTGSPRSRVTIPSGSPTGSRTARSDTGSKATTRLDNSRPAMVRAGARMPATTCAAVTTRPPATPKPEPTWARRQSSPLTPTVAATSRSTWCWDNPWLTGGGPTRVGSSTVGTATGSNGPRSGEPQDPRRTTSARATIRPGPDRRPPRFPSPHPEAPDGLTAPGDGRGSGMRCGRPSGGRDGRHHHRRARSGSGPQRSRRTGIRARRAPSGTGWPARCSACRPR